MDRSETMVVLHYTPKSGRGVTTENFRGHRLSERIMCKFRQRVECYAYEQGSPKQDNDSCIGSVWHCHLDDKWKWFYDNDYEKSH